MVFMFVGAGGAVLFSLKSEIRDTNRSKMNVSPCISGVVSKKFPPAAGKDLPNISSEPF